MNHPNLLFIFPDQMRGQAMGFLNEEPVQTPKLDQFASQGLVLNNASATYPVCSPFRAMLMTGKYPHANKVIGNCTSKTAPLNVQLQESDRCWSDILYDMGYSLGYIGKWHLDSPHEPYINCRNNEGEIKWNEWCPPNRRHGFDFWYSYGTYDYHNRPMYWHDDAQRSDFHYVDQWGPEHEADLAIKYLRNENGAYRDSDRPFGLVVAMNPPHMPYEFVPERYVRQYADLSDDELCTRPNIPPAGTHWGDYYRQHIRNYYAMITGVDNQFGRILEALDDAGLADNTIVVFTSDHGNCLGIHNMISKNNHYEESVRVPFLIRWSGVIPPRSDDLLFSAPDIYPTLMELMGFREKIPGEIQGTSYAELFRGTDQLRPLTQLCLRVMPEKPDYGWRAVRTHTHTFVVIRQPGKEEQLLLYNNEEDPYQLKNIAPDSAELVAHYADKLVRLLRETGDPW